MARTREPSVVHETEASKVYTWRLRELERAGMPRPLAKKAADSEYDLHRMISMLEHNCSPELLLDIIL